MTEADARQAADIAGSGSEAAGPARATEKLIERFGGIRPMAAKLKIPVTTVQGWKKRGAIPAARHGDILQAAETLGVDLETIDVAATEPAAPEGQGPDAGLPGTAGAPWWKHPATWIGGGIGLFVFVVALLLLAALYIVKQKNADLAHRLNMFESQAASLESRVSTLEKAGHGPETASAQSADMARRIADLTAESAQIAALSQKVQDLQASAGSPGVLGQTVGGLQQTVAALQGNVQALSQSLESTRAKVAEIDTAFNQRRAENARQFALLLAADQLRQAAETSQPFQAELNMARSLGLDDPEFIKELDALAPYAGDGAPTLNELRVEFADIATEIVRSNVVGDGSSWMREALYRLGSVLSVRRVGSGVASKNVAETSVAHAESKLEEDDLAGAVASLGNLTGLPREVAASWVDSAQRRLAVDAALGRLSDLATRRLQSFQGKP